MSEAVKREHIAVQGYIRCTICGAIFHGKGDDIAPLGGRTIYAWDKLACKICDQWGHGLSDLEWFPDAELPEDMDTLRWSLDKAMACIDFLRESGKLKRYDLWEASCKVGDNWKKTIERRYGGEKKIAYCKEHCNTGYAMMLDGYSVMGILATEGEEFLRDKDRAWVLRCLPKDDPNRVEAEQKVEEWLKKFPEVDIWHDDYDPEVHILTKYDLVRAVEDQKHHESWQHICDQFFAIDQHNSRAQVFEVLQKQIAAGGEIDSYLLS